MYLKKKYNRARYALFWARREIVTFKKNGQTFKLAILDPNDFIQGQQKLGKFYEEEELDALSAYFPLHGTFVDVGANTGQHSIYFAKLKGANIVAIEPVPESYKLLQENFRLNGLLCNLFKVALSDVAGHADFDFDLDNLGAAWIIQSGKGEIATARGDDILLGRKIDMIKIDTERFEMKVLAGLKETIAREQPLIFVEVDNENTDQFSRFLSEIGYELRYRNKRYPRNENFLIAPIR